MRSLRSKLLRLIPVLFIVTFATFAMVRLLPGDPARAFLGPEAPQEQVDLLSEEMGLDENVFVAYVDWLGDVLRATSASRTAPASRSPRRCRSASRCRSS